MSFKYTFMLNAGRLNSYLVTHLLFSIPHLFYTHAICHATLQCPPIGLAHNLLWPMGYWTVIIKVWRLLACFHLPSYTFAISLVKKLQPRLVTSPRRRMRDILLSQLASAEPSLGLHMHEAYIPVVYPWGFVIKYCCIKI